MRPFFVVGLLLLLALAPSTARADGDALVVTIEYTAGHTRLGSGLPDGCSAYSMQSLPPIFVVECTLPEGTTCSDPWVEVGFAGVSGGLHGRATCGDAGAPSAHCEVRAKFPPPVPLPPTFHTCAGVSEGSGAHVFVCRAVPLEGLSALQAYGSVTCRAPLA